MEFRCELSPKQVMVWVEKDTKAKEVTFFEYLRLELIRLVLPNYADLIKVSHCIAYHTQVTHLPMPNIKKISCGPNHTVAVDENNKVAISTNLKLNTPLQAFSWGFGGYGRLGHSETADELVRGEPDLGYLSFATEFKIDFVILTVDFERCHV